MTLTGAWIAEASGAQVDTVVCGHASNLCEPDVAAIIVQHVKVHNSTLGSRVPKRGIVIQLYHPTTVSVLECLQLTEAVACELKRVALDAFHSCARYEPLERIHTGQQGCNGQEVDRTILKPFR
uniref:Uncharacterized protein n=1 Tax=Anopheles funestus TaxID=62324 RepID=A0A182RBH1_ANOFN